MLLSRAFLRPVALGLLAAAPLTVDAQSPRRPRLFKDARQILAMAQAQGRRDVMLLVATVPGQSAAVVQRLESMGGVVRYREDAIGYLRVRLPIASATAFAESDGIEAITADMDDSFPMRMTPDGRLSDGRLAPDTLGKWPPAWGDYPLRNPYSPLADIDARDFRRRNPTFDGRGVTIAVLDGNIDLLHASFGTALTIDGKRVPKMADFLNVTDPIDDAGLMPQWVDMRETVTASGGNIAYRGRTYTAPRAGTYRIGIFSERRFNNPANGAYMDQDVDRNGNPRGDDGEFAVLWDEASNTVWVDTDRDRSWADEKALTDYRVREEIGVFGTDKPGTAARESIGFAVQTDRANKFVSINIGIYQHATLIMGSVVGNKATGGLVEGIAPNARIVSMHWAGIAHAMLEGLIAAYKHPAVDLIVLEQSVAVASIPYLLADASHPISIIVQRLAETYDKLVFVPGSNNPAFGFVAEDGLAPLAVSVGGYQSQESYRMHLGLVPEGKDHLHWGALSHGPSGIGQLKPDLLAPSGQVSTDIGYLYRKNMQVARGLYAFPAGYAVDGGTSTATPMAAGAAALVLSAARQSKVPYDAKRLKLALTGSSRFIPSLAAHEQGNGLIQVEAAFRLLRALSPSSAPVITSRAPVRTKLAGLLPVPDEGVGIFEREGWKAGDRGMRTITFRRSTGAPGPMTFRVSWSGNNGTFASAPTVTLPLNEDVAFPVEIAPMATGAHSAVLTLDHDAVPGHAYRMLNTVVAALRPDASNGHAVSTEVTLRRPGDASTFIEVPRGASALFVRVASPDTTARLVLISPSRDYRSACSFGVPAASGCAIANPEPGVWEVNTNITFGLREYDPERPNPLKPVTATVTARLVGVDVAIDNIAAAGATSNAADVTISATSRLGALNAAVAPVELSSTRRETRSIAQGEQHLYEVVVPPGATSLRAAVAIEGETGADLDVYLLDCTVDTSRAMPAAAEQDSANKAPPPPMANCGSGGMSASREPGGVVEARNPRPGRWVVVVDAFAVPGGAVRYAYMDALADPRLGTLSVADAATPRERGTAWSTQAHVWVGGRVPAGRALEARVAVVDRSLRGFDGAPVLLGSTWVPLSLVPRQAPDE